ncbi:MAG: LamG domain-containing protein, partial [Verrucomicrobiae bacterium]|nr:LamG domain-containing protein [Verrucomicrobiae bacterium]
PGLVAHLPLAGDLIDVTGRGNNGTKVNNPLYVPDGPLNKPALRYSTEFTEPGTANYVSLGVRPDFNFSSNVSFTVAFWIRLPVNYQGGDLPFLTDTTNSTFNKGFVFAPSYGEFGTASEGETDGAWAFSVFDATSGGAGGHGPDNQINDGGWSHLVYVIDRTQGSTVYVNGVPSQFIKQQGTSVKDAGDIYTGAPVTIGQDPSGNYGEIGSGDISDLGIWRRALTPLEAASIYVAGAVNQLSFTGTFVEVVTVEFEWTNDELKLTWPTGTLQAADSLDGLFTNVAGAVSPYTVPTATATHRFFRVSY